MPTDVDLVVNTFEPTYRTVLSPGFFPEIARQNAFAFKRHVALINNVEDLDDVVARAQALVDAGELHEYRVVSELLPRALQITGLKLSDLGRLLHYSDCSLVAVTMPGSPWMMYWDADVQLEEPVDWISPALALMESDPRVLVANPRWAPVVGPETIEISDDLAIGWGFSDQLYLARRRDLAAPIYHERCLARYRFPASAIADVFEARVDSHMRHNGLVRATYLKARYTHLLRPSGSATEPLTPREWLRRKRNSAALLALQASPWKPACCRHMPR